MRRLLLFFASTILYMEMVYHVAAFGFKSMNPLFALPLILLVAGVQTLLCRIFKESICKVLIWIFLAVDFLIFFSQLVYIRIFSQPLLLDAIVHAGGAALTDFGTEAIHGILACTGAGVLMIVPLTGMYFILRRQKYRLVGAKKKDFVKATIYVVTGLFATCLVLVCGYKFKWKSYGEYQSFYDPPSIICKYGVLPTIQRDLLGDILLASGSALEDFVSQADEPLEGVEPSVQKTEEIIKEVPKEAILDTSPNVLNVNFTQMKEGDVSDEVKQLAAYMEASEGTNKNAYTGMFEGYNLIYMTAEGFSPYAIDETLTPTLYELTHSGFVIDDYYVPLWQTSTSDGEYVNLTGLVPDQQFSMRRTSENEQPYSLPAYFAREGVKSYAYHNNSLSYYDRYKSHPNLGYDFKAAKSGKLSDAEWASQLFDMENEDLWPCSDLEMMQATLSEYINEERFHVYYMTISGHMEYTFGGNDMSKRYQEEVADLPYSEGGRAYIACNMDLDRALEYLIAELEAAGKLENTVIAISSDHYPYGLAIEDLEELAGKELEGTLDLYRNSLILWNSKMETVKIEKTCSAIDLLPTIYNLFGFEYDSRLFAGKDMLSDSESFVVFSNQSFLTDAMSYDGEKQKAVMLDGSDVNLEELEKNQQRARALFEYSAGILNENFYKYVNEAVVQ